jgi:hypothetical protein
MKKIAILTLVLFSCFAAAAQTNLKKKIADSTCACLSETPDIDKKTAEELQMAIGQCMMKKSLEDFMALAAERNIELTDAEGMQKLGTEIFLELTKADCKAMNAVLLKISQGGATDSNTETVMQAPSNLQSTKGVVKNVETKDFIYVTVLSGAKSVQLVWSDMVANGNTYAENIMSLKNKTLNFTYTEKEVYSIRAKAYITVKMIYSVN